MRKGIFRFLLPSVAPQTNSATPSKSQETDSSLDISLKAESILLEVFNHASVNAYQVKEDIARTFNIYLIGVSIVASALAAAGGFILTNNIGFETNGTFILSSLYFFTIILAITLLIFGTISITFFSRFVSLAQEYLESVGIMGDIKELYVRELRQQMPSIERVLGRYHVIKDFGGIPFVIRYIVTLVGSLCFGIAFFVVWGISVTSGVWLDRLQEIFSLIVFILSILGHRQYYRRKNN